MLLPYSVARILADIAERRALEMGIPMVTALVDEFGGLLFLGRMDGALPASTELAANKAYTAAALRLPTDEVGRLSGPGQMLYGLQNTHQGRIVIFGGGLPLRFDGKPAGAIGVSGGTVDEDIIVAKAAVEAFMKMEALTPHIKSLLPSGIKVAGGCEGLAMIVDRVLDEMNLETNSLDRMVLGGSLILSARGD